MNKLIALLLPAALTAFSFSASAGVAPTAATSALAQSGAKVASPAKQLVEDKEVNSGHQENSPKDSAK